MATIRRGASPLLQARMLELAGNPEGARKITFVEFDGVAKPFPVRRVCSDNSLSEGEAPGGLWHIIHTLAPCSVLLVLASSLFDESDDIRNDDAFLEYVRTLPVAGA